MTNITPRQRAALEAVRASNTDKLCRMREQAHWRSLALLDAHVVGATEHYARRLAKTRLEIAALESQQIAISEMIDPRCMTILYHPTEGVPDPKWSLDHPRCMSTWRPANF